MIKTNEEREIRRVWPEQGCHKRYQESPHHNKQILIEKRKRDQPSVGLSIELGLPCFPGHENERPPFALTNLIDPNISQSETENRANCKNILVLIFWDSNNSGCFTQFQGVLLQFKECLG